VKLFFFAYQRMPLHQNKTFVIAGLGNQGALGIPALLVVFFSR